jgi:membrane protease YdiL (CAAX protease family)
MPNTASRNEFMAFEQKPEDSAPRRSLLSPPAGIIHGQTTIFWNEREMRAGWRVMIYLALFFVIGGAESFLAVFLRLPFLWRFWQGIFWGLVMISAMILLIRLLGGFSFGYLALDGQALWGYAALWGLVFLTVGFFEEFFFRGYTQFTLASGIGFWPAATAISAAFAALHLRNGGEGPVGALSLFVIGMFFCLTLRRTGNLWFAVGLHASFDWGETFLFSVPNSGVVAPGHLLNSSLHGPAWLTGGTVGPEGSVMAFAVIAVAAVIFSRVYPPKEENHQPK